VISKKSGHIAVLSANIIYGANYAIAKEVMPEYIGPFAFIFLRVAGAVLLFFTASLFIKEKMESKDIRKCFMLALFGVAINQLLFFKGLSITSPVNAALMMTTNPVQVLIIAWILLGERITLQKSAGIVLGLCGALLLILLSDYQSEHEASFAGDLMVFINSLSWAAFIVMVKPLMMKYHPVTVMKWVFLSGLILVSPFGISEFQEARFSELTPYLWLHVAFVVVATTFIAYLLNVSALKTLSPTVVSYYIYLQPLLAALFGIFFGYGSPQWQHALSAALIFAGVYLVSISNKRRMESKT